MINFKNYWKKFLIKGNDGKEYYDGIKFENLIKELLSVMYGKNWSETHTTHDGNKDFYLIQNGELLWAECKNYKDTIALKVLAPTLVMAQICDADVILFFSRSDINRFAKNKIVAFGYKASKKIFFYDAEILENLILKYNNKLPLKFQIAQKNIVCNSEIKNFFNVSEFFFPSVFSCMITDQENYKNYTAVSILHYNEPFSIMISCNNNSIQSGELEFLFADNNVDKNCYEYINNNISPNNIQIKKECLQPGESKAFLINLRVSVFKPSILLPRFTVRFVTANNQTVEWTSAQVTVQCKWVGMTKLLGDHYNNIITQVEEKLVENTSFSAMFLLGSSGTGKSRVLQECHCPLLKYGYRILELNVTKEHQTSVLLKEIIYFLYEAPAELITEIIKSRLKGMTYDGLNTGTDMIAQIAEMIDMLTESNLSEFMDKYKELLFEKIAIDKIAIIIDNMQFASNDFQEFWRSYIKYSVNQCRENKSILIISANSDYMTEETSKTIYTLKNSNIQHLIDETVDGFKDLNQGILFLRELIHIRDDVYDELFKDIISSISLNPFNLFQVIKLMEENEVIRHLPDMQGYIFSEEAVWKTSWKIPMDINDTLKRRLDFIMEYLDSEKLYHILSACYLLETVDKQNAEMLNINITDLEFLAKHQILMYSETGYCFVHDIFRKYFEQQHSDKRLYCLRNLNLSGKYVMQYNILYKLTKICVEKNNNYIVTFCQKRDLNSIPIRLRSIFLEKLFNSVITCRSVFNDDAKWVGALAWICNQTRSSMGSAKALEFYNRVYDYIENEIDDFSVICSSDLRHLVHSHCDIFIQMHRRNSAVDFAKKVLNAMRKEPVQKIGQEIENYKAILDEYFVIKAIMYNRIFCAYNNAYPSESIIKIRDKAITKSRMLIPFIQDIHKRNLISYLNDSDEGYRYYGFFSDYDTLMDIWKKCLTDIPNTAPEKTMNYYRKCVQYYLIQQNEEKTRKNIEKGRDYLEEGAYSHEPLIFNTFFTMAEAMNCLQHNPKEKHFYIENLLDSLVKMQLLLKSDKMGDIFMLKGISAFYNDDEYTVYLALKKAYLVYYEKETTNYWIKRELVKENIITAYAIYNIQQKDYDISFLPQECINQLSHFRQDSFQAKGIIRTQDLLFNLPLVV